MIVKCSACQTRFQYDETRFKGERAKRFQCTKCRAIFEVLNPYLAGPDSAALFSSKSETPPPPKPAPPSPARADAPVPPPPIPPQPPSPPPSQAEFEPRINTGARLAYLTGPKSSTAVDLTRSATVIGRDEGDIVTLDPETSRRHAVIEVMQDGSVWLQDLGSTNGTVTNGEPITSKVRLADRQEFTCGNSSFMLLQDKE
jgi:pSer/pThr/pTyr-binding forkhead associated (FHA) protein